jgi:hypothetical protein
LLPSNPGWALRAILASWPLRTRVTLRTGQTLLASDPGWAFSAILTGWPDWPRRTLRTKIALRPRRAGIALRTLWPRRSLRSSSARTARLKLGDLIVVIVDRVR